MQELKVLALSRHQSGVEDTVRVCHNQKNCQEVSQSKEHQESATIKRISRTSHNQKFYQGVSQLWVLSGSTTLVRYCHFGVSPVNYSDSDYKKSIQGVLHLKVHKGSVAIKSSARECHNLSTQGSVTIKSTTRDRHNQKYCHGPQQ